MTEKLTRYEVDGIVFWAGEVRPTTEAEREQADKDAVNYTYCTICKEVGFNHKHPTKEQVDDLG